MGLYVGGLSDGIDMDAIAAEMREPLYEVFNAHVRIIDPNRSEAPKYDPRTDTGGGFNPMVIFDTGERGALIQPLRSAISVEFGSQSVGLQGIRIQTKMDVPISRIRSGFIAEVVNGGQDRTLETFQFSIIEGFDSSIAWGRIIEASVVTAR